jgi:polyhydroxybutyrate depolymerase
MDRMIPLLATIATLTLVEGAAACDTPETACRLDTGSYQIVLPDTPADQTPAIVFLHGHGGSAKNVMNLEQMVTGFTARGYAVIAPNGARGAQGVRSWSFLPEFGGRDDFTFVQDVLKDAVKRFDVDPEHSVLAGFSSGAFMVNYLACRDPDAFTAYLPVAGGFWRPQPKECEGPLRLYHSHGWADRVVPLEGRILGGGRFVQGDIWAGLELWRDTLGCETHAPAEIRQNGDLMMRSWSCGDGAALTFELFPGGHRVPSGWAGRVVDWLEADPTDAQTGG